jgi:myosin-9
MRPDIVALLRSSDRAYVRQLIGMDPVAMFRWGILRATIRGMAAFNEAGRRWAAKTAGTCTAGAVVQYVYSWSSSTIRVQLEQ